MTIPATPAVDKLLGLLHEADAALADAAALQTSPDEPCRARLVANRFVDACLLRLDRRGVDIDGLALAELRDDWAATRART